MTTSQVIDVVNTLDDSKKTPVVILETSPMTDVEQVELQTQEELARVADQDRLVQTLTQAKAIYTIFDQKLYRSKHGGRNFASYIEQEGWKLSATGTSFKYENARYLKGFYAFRKILSKYPGVPAPTNPRQVRPLIAQLERHPEAAVKIWKGALTDAARIAAKLPSNTKGELAKKDRAKSPTSAHVTQAANAFLANEFNAARRQTPAQQAASRAGLTAANASRQSSPPPAPSPAPQLTPVSQVQPQPQPQPSPQPQASIPAWELDTYESGEDPRRELRDVFNAVCKVNSGLSTVTAFLTRGHRKHGDEYFEMLKAVDAGIWSFDKMEASLTGMRDEIQTVLDLISGQGGQKAASQQMIDINLPTREEQN